VPVCCCFCRSISSLLLLAVAGWVAAAVGDEDGAEDEVDGAAGAVCCAHALAVSGPTANGHTQAKSKRVFNVMVSPLRALAVNHR